MILRFDAIPCPACASWTLEWSDEVSGSSCETCGYAAIRDDADREPAGLALLRRWRAELAEPIMGSALDPSVKRESAVLLRQYRIENCAALADMYGVPRMGAEEDMVFPSFPLTPAVTAGMVPAMKPPPEQG